MYALKSESPLSIPIYDLLADSFDCKCSRKSVFYNKLKHFGKGQDKKEKGIQGKRNLKSLINANGKSRGWLQDWHLNCNNLAGNSRLIKYWTGLDWCRGSIIITVEDCPENLKSEESKNQLHKKAFGEFSLVIHLYILPNLEKSSRDTNSKGNKSRGQELCFMAIS